MNMNIIGYEQRIVTIYEQSIVTILEAIVVCVRMTSVIKDRYVFV